MQHVLQEKNRCVPLRLSSEEIVRYVSRLAGNRQVSYDVYVGTGLDQKIRQRVIPFAKPTHGKRPLYRFVNGIHTSMPFAIAGWRSCTTTLKSGNSLASANEADPTPPPTSTTSALAGSDFQSYAIISVSSLACVFDTNTTCLISSHGT